MTYEELLTMPRRQTTNVWSTILRMTQSGEMEWSLTDGQWRSVWSKGRSIGLLFDAGLLYKEHFSDEHVACFTPTAPTGTSALYEHLISQHLEATTTPAPALEKS
jgi:hypothetical protein